jgi:hypothetical protein
MAKDARATVRHPEGEVNTRNASGAPLELYRVDETGGKAKWKRVGKAYTNRDGSLKIVLEQALEPGASLNLRSCKSGFAIEVTGPGDKLYRTP